jgi:RNA-directed DNA polymerase
MSDKRQKNQLELAFLAEDTGEAPSTAEKGTESPTAKRKAESPAIGEQLMEEVCERENCKQALSRVKANKGSPGVDGMAVGDLPGYLKQHWPAIRERLLSGAYGPQPVKRVEIPKPDGSGSGEVLRPGKPRQADGQDRRKGWRQAVVEADPGVSHGWSNGRRAGQSGG